MENRTALPEENACSRSESAGEWILCSGGESFEVPNGLCAAFTGYRPEKIRLSIASGDARRLIGQSVRRGVSELYDRGVRYFLTGMAEGFDLWAAREVLSLRDEGRCPEAEVVAVIPFRGQPANYPQHAREEYRYILSHATHAVVLSESYYKECFHRRNDFLVAHSSVVVCYYDGLSGGTRYTVNAAKRKGLPLINLCCHQPTLF